MLTPAQNGVFRPLVLKAWAAHAARAGLDPADKAARERWYRETLCTATGFYTTKEIARPADFDCACLAFARVAGDDQAITWWSGAVERRLRYVINAKLLVLGKVLGQLFTWSYAEALARQMGETRPLAKCDERRLREVIAALDTHIHRHAERSQPCATIPTPSAN